jgi:alkanesulfonate monooxygenase SsuD/methylene tetrahydromethanopterin reductase-like flavin-dependent oxidoreductase (luciferase family)
MITPIQFGWRVPDFPERLLPDPHQRAALLREQIFDYMDTIQDGLDSAWVGDHFFPWPPADLMDQSLDTHEAWTILNYLLARYPRMRMGTIVLSQSYRPPAFMAKAAAVLQWLSGGRLIFGIGAGWKENEYRAYGYDFPPDRVRLAQLEEYVQILRKMWTEDSPTFQGEYYSIHNAYCAPRPNPVPPLLIGGAGPKVTLRIVAQYADWCNLNGFDLEMCRRSLDTLRGHCQAVGRDYNSIGITYSNDCVAVAPTHAEAERMKDASFFGRYLPMIGTPDEVAAQIQPLVDLGVTHFIFRFVDFPRTEGVQMFIKEVVPRFR